jgi:membrane protease YdiL (CAAX protease family)
MPEEIANPVETVPSALAANQESGPQALRWFELSLVFLVSFTYPLLYSFNIVRDAFTPTFSWPFMIVQEVCALLLLSYVLLRRGLRLKNIGLEWSATDLLRAVFVALNSYLFYLIGYCIIHFVFHVWTPWAPPSAYSAMHMAWNLSPLSVVVVILNPCFEELIVRAYLMSEIKALTGSWALAGLASVAVQTSYHLYYGWPTAVILGFEFLAFSIYYALTRRVAPIILAHGFFDFAAVTHLW